jgi:hypothetical protein
LFGEVAWFVLFYFASRYNFASFYFIYRAVKMHVCCMFSHFYIIIAYFLENGEKIILIERVTNGWNFTYMYLIRLQVMVLGHRHNV